MSSVPSASPPVTTDNLLPTLVPVVATTCELPASKPIPVTVIEPLEEPTVTALPVVPVDVLSNKLALDAETVICVPSATELPDASVALATIDVVPPTVVDAMSAIVTAEAAAPTVNVAVAVLLTQKLLGAKGF